jgi:hypothetical protein
MKRIIAAAFAAMVVLAPVIARADTVFIANLTGGQEVPPTGSTATGTATLTLNTAETNIHISITVNNFTNAITASHVHKAMFGQNGSVQFSIGAFTGTIDADWAAPTAANVADLRGNRLYVNVHSTVFPGGEIRGQARLHGAMTFGANLTQAQEVPPTGSAGTGYADLTLDNSLNLHLELSATGLSSTISASHIHKGAVGVNGAVVFNIGAFSGTTSVDFILTPAQRDEILAGLYYVNIHTANFPGGEIRGQIGNASAADAADGTSGASSDRILAFPNPSRGAAILSYQMARAEVGEIGVYTPEGRRLRTLVSGPLGMGRHEVAWDGRDETGAPVPSGIYFYLLRAGGRSESGRLTMIR